MRFDRARCGRRARHRPCRRRDPSAIKPDNILIGASGDAVVADFGLARALQGAPAVSATNQVMGTPHYCGPEQARGREIDGRNDLSSLGVTRYRAATGHLPFAGDDW